LSVVFDWGFAPIVRNPTQTRSDFVRAMQLPNGHALPSLVKKSSPLHILFTNPQMSVVPALHFPAAMHA
jgi:hypothetical protein